MEVSKLTLSDELTHQTSSLTKALLWMEMHPNHCQNTNIRRMAKTICLDKDRPLRMTTFSTEQLIYQLMRRGWVTRNGNRRRSDFVINYGHPELPKELINQPVEVVKRPNKNTMENVNRRNADIVRRNGGTLKEIILKWMKENPEKTKEVRLRELADMILKDTKVSAKPDSLYAIMGRMAKDGTVKRTRGETDYTFNFEVAKDAKIKYKPVGGGVKKDVIAANGGTLESNILGWLVNNQDRLKNTTAMALAKRMIKELNINTTFESLYTRFRRMYTKGENVVRRLHDDGLCDFEIISTSGKCYVKPEEKPDFKTLVQDGMDPIHALELTEEKKENKMEEQTVNLPEGKTISLVININFGK